MFKHSGGFLKIMDDIRCNEIAVFERWTFLHVDSICVSVTSSRQRAKSDSVMDCPRDNVRQCVFRDAACKNSSEDELTSVGQDDIESICSADLGWSTDSEEGEFAVDVCSSASILPGIALPTYCVPVALRPAPVQFVQASHWHAAPVMASQARGNVDPRTKFPNGRASRRTTETSRHTNCCENHDHELTTIILRNIPHDCTRNLLTNVLDREGFRCKYDFVHVPVNFQDMAGLSYALVNFVDNGIARCALEHLQGHQIPTSSNSGQTSTCSVAWSTPNQGLQAHIERYRNSPMMHESVPSEYKPALFHNGVFMPFPEPTKRLRAPRIRHPKIPQA